MFGELFCPATGLTNTKRPGLSARAFHVSLGVSEGERMQWRTLPMRPARLNPRDRPTMRHPPSHKARNRADDDAKCNDYIWIVDAEEPGEE